MSTHKVIHGHVANVVLRGPFIFPDILKLVGQPMVDTGECVALIQHFMPAVGPTNMWAQGEQAARVKKLKMGTVLANFDPKTKRWPGLKHNNHAVFFWKHGVWNEKLDMAESMFVVEQFNGPGQIVIQARELRCDDRPDESNRQNRGGKFYIVR
jgi:hypothetical protein